MLEIVQLNDIIVRIILVASGKMRNTDLYTFSINCFVTKNLLYLYSNARAIICRYIYDSCLQENLEPMNEDELDCGHALLRQMLGGHDFKNARNAEKAAQYRSVFARSLAVSAADSLAHLVRMVYDAKIKMMRSDRADDGIR